MFVLIFRLAMSLQFSLLFCHWHVEDENKAYRAGVVLMGTLLSPSAVPHTQQGFDKYPAQSKCTHPNVDGIFNHHSTALTVIVAYTYTFYLL